MVREWDFEYHFTINVVLQKIRYKWDEVPYVDIFFPLRNDHETQKKCKLLTLDSNAMMIMEI